MTGMSAGLGLLAALGALIGLELAPEWSEPPAGNQGQTAAADAPAPVVAPAPPTDRRAEQVATILARPLFSPERRPADVPPVATVEPPIPRLTGTIVGPFGHHAVFAVDGRQVDRTEGDEIAGWTVLDIGNGFASLRHADQPDVVRLVVTTDAAQRVVAPGPSIGEGFAWNNPCGRRHSAAHGSRSAGSGLPVCAGS